MDIRDGKYEQFGEMDFDDADDANIPVNVFLRPLDPAEDEEDGIEKEDGWVLLADNFMPRKLEGFSESYKFYSKDREVLVHMVQKHWRPLYEIALELLKLEPAEEDKSASFYYWTKRP
jgi:hypothetical protein